ncbi:MAG: DNA repair protein RecO [Pseudomonadota bacterium]|nr:DNA repair protein RecO [Pseudomonadota bacterium]
MEWNDQGVILGLRRHGEGSVIVEAMTPRHGRHLGLVRGGRSAQMRSVLQAGNSVRLTWRARLDEHLGNYAVEAETLRAATLMQSGLGLYGLQTLANHLRLLPERDPHLSLYQAGLVILDHLDEPEKAARLMIRFELALLDELGFGLDLSQCAATGTRGDLAYVSPKTGRAVSREGAGQWADRLLALPPFLAPSQARVEETPLADQLDQGFRLAGHFLARHVWEPRAIRPPDEREGFRKAVSAALA